MGPSKKTLSKLLAGVKSHNDRIDRQNRSQMAKNKPQLVKGKNFMPNEKFERKAGKMIGIAVIWDI